MKKVVVKLRHAPDHETPVGQLAETDGRVYFEYAPRFLELGWELSPWLLPTVPGLQEHKERDFGPLPGVFDDSLPDGWGLLLMDRHFRGQGIEPATLSALDRLLFLGNRTMGGLTYHPAVETSADLRPFDLHELATQAQRVLTGEVEELLPTLLRAGGSPGGARPKVLVGKKGDVLRSGEDDLPEGFEHWLVKFGGATDGDDAGAVEYAYAKMAGAAGVAMPPTELFETREGGRYFGVRRFDRSPGNQRLHMHTLGGLIHSDFRISNCDYTVLLNVTRDLTQNHEDVVECFRRMVFNVVAHNRDDHVKNFAFLMDSRGEWSVSPAYDLTFSHGPGGRHSMTIGGVDAVPTREGCLKLAEEYGIGRDPAAGIIDSVNEAVAGWRRFAGEADCSASSTSRIAAAHLPLR